MTVDCNLLDNRAAGRGAFPVALSWALRLALWRRCRWRWALLNGIIGWIGLSAAFASALWSFTQSNWRLAEYFAWSGLIMVPLFAAESAFRFGSERARLACVVRRCRRCDYSLLGTLRAGRCPECALAFRDDVPDLESDPVDRIFRTSSVGSSVIDLFLAAAGGLLKTCLARLPSVGRSDTFVSVIIPGKNNLFEPSREQQSRRRWLGLFLPMFLFINVCAPLLSGGYAFIRSQYPDGSLGIAIMVSMRFVMPALICVVVYLLIRKLQRAAYARFIRPEHLMEFLEFGRCPACLGDLLGVEPDPADGCRVCRNCGGAWRLSEA